MISLAAKASRHGRTLGHPDLKRIPSHRIQSAQWPTLEDANRIFWKGGKAATVQPSPTRVFDRVPFLGGFEWGSVTRKPHFSGLPCLKPSPATGDQRERPSSACAWGMDWLPAKLDFPRPSWGTCQGLTTYTNWAGHPRKLEAVQVRDPTSLLGRKKKKTGMSKLALGPENGFACPVCFAF